MAEFRLGWLDLLTLPVSLPLQAAWTGLEEAVALAHRQQHRQARLPEQLADLQAAYEMGEITEEQYLQAIARLTGAAPGPQAGPGMPEGPSTYEEGGDDHAALEHP